MIPLPVLDVPAFKLIVVPVLASGSADIPVFALINLAIASAASVSTVAVFT